MKVKCRFCCNLIGGNQECMAKNDKVISESAAKRARICKDFSLIKEDYFGEQDYKPVQTRRKRKPNKNQINIFEGENND